MRQALLDDERYALVIKLLGVVAFRDDGLVDVEQTKLAFDKRLHPKRTTEVYDGVLGRNVTLDCSPPRLEDFDQRFSEVLVEANRLLDSFYKLAAADKIRSLTLAFQATEMESDTRNHVGIAIRNLTFLADGRPDFEALATNMSRQSIDIDQVRPVIVKLINDCRVSKAEFSARHLHHNHVAAQCRQEMMASRVVKPTKQLISLDQIKQEVIAALCKYYIRHVFNFILRAFGHKHNERMGVLISVIKVAKNLTDVRAALAIQHNHIVGEKKSFAALYLPATDALFGPKWKDGVEPTNRDIMVGSSGFADAVEGAYEIAERHALAAAAA